MPTSVRRQPKQSARPRRAPLRVAARQAMTRLTAAGRYFVLMALVMVGIGVHRRINLLMLLGDALLVMAVLNLLSARRGLHRLQGRRRLDEWLFARTPFTVDVQVSNPGKRKLWGLRIVEEGLTGSDGRGKPADGRSAMPSHAATWLVERLSPQGAVSWQHTVTMPRRGRYAWGELRAVSGYPFGLVECRVTLVPQKTTTVLPCLGWLHRGRFLRHLRGLALKPQLGRFRHTPRTHPAAQVEFHGLRSYRSGDSLRLIHWRTSARHGELMVREFEDEPSDNLLVVLDPTLPAESDYCGVPLRDQFEDVVSLTATICWEWCRRRGDRLVVALEGADPVVLDGVTGPGHARRILESLAELECHPGPANTAVIARLQTHRLPSATVVVVALGRSALTDPLGRALGRRVNALDATRTDRFDFYKPPTS